MRSAQVLMSLIMAAIVGVGAAASEALADQAIRSINADRITLGDIAERMRDLEAQGVQRPTSVTSQRQWISDILEQLTNEMLLVQEAKRNGAQLDRTRVAKIVMEEARKSGRGLDLESQARKRVMIERQQLMDAAVSFYSERLMGPSPIEIRALYQEHLAQFTRPARCSGAVIALRPASQAEIDAQLAAELALLKDARAVSDPALKAAHTAAWQAFNADDATSATQAAVLNAFLVTLGSSTASVLTGDDRALQARSAALLTSRRGQRSKAQVLEYAAEVRALIEAAAPEERAAIAAAHARVHAQGVFAQQAGQFTQVEPGAMSASFDQQVFSATTGATVGPFAVGDMVWVVHITQLESGRQRDLTDAWGDIEAELLRLRPIAIRAQLVTMLRNRAAIAELRSLDTIIPK